MTLQTKLSLTKQAIDAKAYDWTAVRRGALTALAALIGKFAALAAMIPMLPETVKHPVEVSLPWAMLVAVLLGIPWTAQARPPLVDPSLEGTPPENTK